MIFRLFKVVCIFLIIVNPEIKIFGQIEKQAQNNIKVVGAAYGYLKYFYPVKDLTDDDWNHLLYLDINDAKSCKNNIHLKTLLEKVFQPIAPNVIFSFEKYNNTSAKFKVDSDWISHCCFWQHIGNGNSFADIYKSAIVNYEAQSLLYPEQKNEKTFISKYLGEGISISFPRIICIMNLNAYNVIRRDSILQEAAAKFPQHPSINDINVRFLNIIKTWTIFQHFFPYWDDVTANKDSLLSAALDKCRTDKTSNDFLKTLQLMTGVLNDGHIEISNENSFINSSYTTGFGVDLIDDCIVVNQIYNDTLSNIKIGDVILKVNGLNTKQLLSNEKYLSGSKQYKRHLLMSDLFAGQQGSLVNITFYSAAKKQEQTIILKRNVSKFNSSTGEDWTINFTTRKSGNVNDSTYYLDLRNISKDSLEATIPILHRFKNVICDLRGYPPLYSIELLNHLLTKPDTAQHWLQTPLISFPDFENVQYQYSGYKNLYPAYPTLKSKFIFLSNSSSISFTELLLAIIKQNKLGTIVGTASAGTNGNINLIELLDNFYCYYTGMRVINPDGSKHHLIGVLPDVIAKPDIASIRKGEDLVYEIALHIIQQYNKQ